MNRKLLMAAMLTIVGLDKKSEISRTKLTDAETKALNECGRRLKQTLEERIKNKN